jgi:general stress protein YciG
MADKGHQGYSSMDEERRREIVSEGGHASHEKGAAHEFNAQEAAEAGRKGSHAKHIAHASRETTEAGAIRASGETPAHEGSEAREGSASSEVARDERSEQQNPTSVHRPKKTRGGTHDQHVTAGKKGGSRIRELIELGYRYEEEHGIGPGRNERSKMAAKRRATKAPGSQGSHETETHEGAGPSRAAEGGV